MSNPHSSAFHALHKQAELLLLPTAWDAASARLLVSAGAKAVATSSAALSWSLGYADGGALPPGELLAAVRRLARGLTVPLSVDIEDGYRASPQDVADFAEAIADSGAVGINIEDADAGSALLAEKIAAIRSRPRCASLFVNARTDVYLRALVPAELAVDAVIERAERYAAAGADGLFVPGLSSLDAVARVVAGTPLPLNLMGVPGPRARAEFRALGVRRISAGPALFLASYARLMERASELLGDHSGAAVGDAGLSYAGMNALLGDAS